MIDQRKRSLPRSVDDDLSAPEQLQSLARRYKRRDPSIAESKMRKRHQEEATEMARLNNELATLKSDTAVTAQLTNKIEQLIRDVKVLKGINYDLMVERTRHCESSRKMQMSIHDTMKETKALRKSLEDAEREAEAMKTRLDYMKKVYNESVQDTCSERSKRVQAEQTLQACLAAQKAIAEKFGARLV